MRFRQLQRSAIANQRFISGALFHSHKLLELLSLFYLSITMKISAAALMLASVSVASGKSISGKSVAKVLRNARRLAEDENQQEEEELAFLGQVRAFVFYVVEDGVVVFGMPLLTLLQHPFSIPSR